MASQRQSSSEEGTKQINEYLDDDEVESTMTAGGRAVEGDQNRNTYEDEDGEEEEDEMAFEPFTTDKLFQVRDQGHINMLVSSFLLPILIPTFTILLGVIFYIF